MDENTVSLGSVITSVTTNEGTNATVENHRTPRNSRWKAKRKMKVKRREQRKKTEKRCVGVVLIEPTTSTVQQSIGNSTEKVQSECARAAETATLQGLELPHEASPPSQQRNDSASHTDLAPDLAYGIENKVVTSDERPSCDEIILCTPSEAASSIINITSETELNAGVNDELTRGVLSSESRESDFDRLVENTSNDSISQSAKNPLHRKDMQVGVVRLDNKPMDVNLAKLVRKQLLEKMLELMTSGPVGKKCAFLKSGLISEGYFLITAATVEARDWVLGLEIGEVEGHKVVIKKAADIRKTVTAIVLLPSENTMKDCMRSLLGQNNYINGLNMNEWVLVKCETVPRGKELLFEIDNESAATLTASPYLNFELTTVKVILPGLNVRPKKIVRPY